MNSLADQLLVLCLLLNFAVLGTSRLAFSVRAVALQFSTEWYAFGLISKTRFRAAGIAGL